MSLIGRDNRSGGPDKEAAHRPKETVPMIPRLLAIAAALAAALALALPAQQEEPPSPPPSGVPTTNLAIREGTLSTVTHRIEEDLGIILQPRGAAAEQVLRDFYVRDATAEDLLNKLHNELGWQWYQDDSMPPNVYDLYTDEDFRTMVLPNLVIEKAFYFQNIPADQAAEFIEPLLSEVGSLFVSPRTNEVIVTDLPQYIEAIERLREQTDVQLYIRMFRIRHADPATVADALERLLSPEGTIEVDERNRTLIVEDLLRNIRRMDIMVELMDVGTELRIYEINYILDPDEPYIDDLLAAIEEIITPDALLSYEERTGQIILDDVPEVHDKVAEIVAAYDRPTRQIMLQADLIQVRTTNELELDTQFAIADDLELGGRNLIGGFPLFPSTTDGEEINPNDIFPVVNLDSGGVRFSYLSTHFRAVLSAALTDSNTRLLLSPRIQVKDRAEASIDVGGEVPFLTSTIDSDTNQTTFEQRAVQEGLVLSVTPTITNTGYIELDVIIENNDANVESRTVVDGSVDVVDRRTQQVETTLVVPDGGTRVIAGLLTSSTTESRRGTPFLSQVPYVGWLFGETRNISGRDNLMIFLTPTIIVESAADYEWRPFYDEMPVSARFMEPLPEEMNPLRPRGVDLLIPSVRGEDLQSVEDLIPVGPSWLDSLSADDLTLGIDEEDLVPSRTTLATGEVVIDGEVLPVSPDAVGSMPATDEEAAVSPPPTEPASFPIPLVSEDLRAGRETEGEEAESPLGARVSTSFVDSGPSPTGRPPTTGSGVQTGGQRPDRSERPGREEQTEDRDRGRDRDRDQDRQSPQEQREPPAQPTPRETNFRN